MNIVVVCFPGSNCDTDCVKAVKAATGLQASIVWHENPLPAQTDLVILPGGFSYGDYLRSGAVARFAPVMSDIQRFAERGGAVLGICNGFQILVEAGLLPGALLPNGGLTFVCRDVYLRVENTRSMFTAGYQPNQILSIPVAHGDGRYYADDAQLRDLSVAFRYVDADGSLSEAANPNGSVRGIAGICNADGNVLGMMPHPERRCEAILGGIDGVALFATVADKLRQRRAVEVSAC